jgi:hypothetical protein
MLSFRKRELVLVGFGVIAGLAIHSQMTLMMPSETVVAAAPAVADPASVAAELSAIKGKLTDQSHVMQDVSYHFGNLWFAGQNQNWDLAKFYLDETQSHLEWAVRVIPKRKDSAGREVDLVAILEAFKNGPLKELHAAVSGHDVSAFEKSYRASLENCYTCHKAADKPFLRLQIPERAETPIMNFDPHATWPK